MMIREATIDDLNRIVEITNACGKHMISQNIFQWNEDYPNIEVFKKDIEKQSLYVIELESKIVGCVCISEKMDAVYKKVKWLTPDTKNMYVHRLAIDPKYQGKGLAIKLMSYAEDLAKTKDFKSIRLDTFSKNPKNNKFYNLQGYKKLGKIFYRSQSDMPFHCYEKII
jgi:ribosomal protein S18 acetylase RimI-like enzyme